MTTQSDFKNFAVFTVDISSVEQKTSRKGEAYAIASATLPMEKGVSMPLRIVVLDGLASSITAGRSTLVGRLGYDEKEWQGTRSCSSQPGSNLSPAMASSATTFI